MPESDARLTPSPAAEVCPECHHASDDGRRCRDRAYVLCDHECVFPPAPEQKPLCESCGYPLKERLYHFTTPSGVVICEQTPAPSADSDEPPERIYVQSDFSFFKATGNGTYYRNPDSNSIEYARVSVGPQEQEQMCKCGSPKDDLIHSVSTDFVKMHPFIAAAPAAPSHSLQQAAREAAEKIVREVTLTQFEWAQITLTVPPEGDSPEFDIKGKEILRRIAAIITEALGGVAGPGEWLPIETCPRNGTNFLASSPASSTFYAHWANGVVDSSTYDDKYGYTVRHATHWMPLPKPVDSAPPDQQEGEEE